MSTKRAGKAPLVGRWGLVEFVEPQLRRLVADRLGVAEAQLQPSVSLADELAADSLDRLEIALAVEAELGIAIPEAPLDEVRLYGDLVALVIDRVRAQLAVPGVDEMAVPVQAKVVLANRGSGTLERAEWLTPYAAQSIMEDALRGGPGSRLELTLPATAADAALAAVRHRFAHLTERGLDVRVGRAGVRSGRAPAAA
jgi:acyl carrier protein